MLDMIERSCQGLADIKLNYKKEYIFYPWNYCVLLWKLFGPVWLVWKNLPGFDSMGNYCCLSNGPQGKQPIWWLPNDVKLPRHKYDNKCDSECDKTTDNCEGTHAPGLTTYKILLPLYSVQTVQIEKSQTKECVKHWNYSPIKLFCERTVWA